MWFALKGDERLGRCATEGCGGQPIYRLEAGGVGSNYCSGCQAAIKNDTGCDDDKLPGTAADWREVLTDICDNKRDPLR